MRLSAEFLHMLPNFLDVRVDELPALFTEHGKEVSNDDFDLLPNGASVRARALVSIIRLLSGKYDIGACLTLPLIEHSDSATDIWP